MNPIWDAAITAMTTAYHEVVVLVDQEKIEEAATLYAERIATKATELHGQVQEGYPPRFEKVDDWIVWTNMMLAQVRRAGTALKNGNVVNSRKELDNLRKVFITLHFMAETANAGDYIAAFRTLISVDRVSIDRLREMKDGVKNNAAPQSAQGELSAFEKARDEWMETVEPYLNMESLSPENVETLREITEPLYMTYGLDLE